MTENKNKDIELGSFKVDKEFIKEFDEILRTHWVAEKERKKIIGEFVKLIFGKLVKK